jgi:hypothetical protein
MITISDLLDNITVQGDIRVSSWTREGEKVIVLSECDGGLSASKLPKRWRNAEVLYMFCPGDGFLHIEVSADD